MQSLSSIPFLTETYTNYPVSILRADLLRYLLLWYDGGLYADIDVHPVRPITLCKPLNPLFTEHHHNISLAVSVGIDEPYTPFHHLKKPLWIDGKAGRGQDTDGESESVSGLLVLPINIWGNGQRHSGAGMFNSEEACTNHRFGRTWKKGWWENIFG